MSTKRKAEDEIHEIPSDDDSDVQIQENTIPVVNLDDDDETPDDNAAATHSPVEADNEQTDSIADEAPPSSKSAQQTDDGGTNELKNIQTEEKPSVDENLLLNMQFRDQELFQLFKGSLTEYLKTTFQLKLAGQKVDVVHHLETASIQVLKAKTGPTGDCITSLKKSASESEQVAEEVDNGMFVIDLTPAKSVKGGPMIPSYKKVFQKVLDNSPKACAGNAKKRPRPKQLCWNCDGDHGLRDCKEPRNFAKILKMKQEFMKKADRYHVDLEQKFGHIVPGRLSAELKKALGLGKRDLPLHIYRMRMFGYPPGWLEDAKITHSGLQLFDSNGDPVQESDESEGEIDSIKMKYDVRKIISFPGFNAPMEKHIFDDAKFYGVPPWMEHQSREAMIRNLEGTLVKGYRRKKLRLGTSAAQPGSEQEAADMDLDDNSENPDESLQTLDSVGECDRYEGSGSQLPTNGDVDEMNTEEPEDGEVNEEDDDHQKSAKFDANDESVKSDSVILVEEEVEVICLDETRAISPSLEDLTRKQLEILKQLEDQSPRVQNDDSLLEDVLMAERLAEEAEAEEDANRTVPTATAAAAANPAPIPQPPAPPAVPVFVFSVPSVPPLHVAPPPPPPAQDDPSERPPEPECLNMDEIKMTKAPFVDDPASMGLKTMSLGTPILTAFSPFNKLPCGEAFSKGVSDVINFENLPNSTGKYERMKSLLTKVRNVITAHNGEPEDESR
ncbi:zinc finger CCHC domain-containing protein 8 homolog [Toxorhynchites rutilus septentrionalis]|uniref:zinc finger CCHC domain-containing protein 8 homolog n=1 Tax=Toxorhynchites rutilus septentrionalis TaxID=329112 RepID=UPI00247B01CC|nr:zinc finger CCHC domain-containing protein 8 homolog [Toxorhynchites rutilus septentrionalis]